MFFYCVPMSSKTDAYGCNALHHGCRSLQVNFLLLQKLGCCGTCRSEISDRRAKELSASNLSAASSSSTTGSCLAQVLDHWATNGHNTNLSIAKWFWTKAAPRFRRWTFDILWWPLSAFRIFQNLSESFRIFQNLSESFRIFQNLSESFRIFQNLSESFRIFQNRSESFRIFQNLSDFGRRKRRWSLHRFESGQRSVPRWSTMSTGVHAVEASHQRIHG